MKEKVLVICKYEKWCVNWFNMLLRFLAYNVYANDKALIVVNKRHRCVCLPEKEISFIPESLEGTKTKSIKPDRIVRWSGHDIKELWDQI